MNKDAIKKTKLSNNQSDFEYWISKSHTERLTALEEIRSEYNNWKYGTKQRLQRVYQIIKPE